jgi:hypothetical protein
MPAAMAAGHFGCAHMEVFMLLVAAAGVLRHLIRRILQGIDDGCYMAERSGRRILDQGLELGNFLKGSKTEVMLQFFEFLSVLQRPTRIFQSGPYPVRVKIDAEAPIALCSQGAETGGEIIDIGGFGAQFKGPANVRNRTLRRVVRGGQGAVEIK